MMILLLPEKSENTLSQIDVQGGDCYMTMRIIGATPAAVEALCVNENSFDFKYLILTL
jgi:hypothetical protein